MRLITESEPRFIYDTVVSGPSYAAASQPGSPLPFSPFHARTFSRSSFSGPSRSRSSSGCSTACLCCRSSFPSLGPTNTKSPDMARHRQTASKVLRVPTAQKTRAPVSLPMPPFRWNRLRWHQPDKAIKQPYSFEGTISLASNTTRVLFIL